MSDLVALQTICAPSDDIVAREIEGEIVIVPLVAGIGDADDELYTLNESGQAIWRLLDGQRTLDQVVGALAETFDSPRADMEKDVVGFVDELVRRGIVADRS